MEAYESKFPNGLKPLTQSKRDRAKERARSSIARRLGPAPKPDQFNQLVMDYYPSQIKRWVYALMLIPLLAFLTLSAMRLYEIGKEMHTGDASILGLSEKSLSGIDVVIGAEFAQIVFVVALSVLAVTTKSKFAFGVGIVLSTAIALVGNVQAGLWGEAFSVFRLLITVAPPIVVLVLGEVLALLWLDTIRANHEAQRLYAVELGNWSAIDREPELHSDWLKVLATAIRDELIRHNGITVDDLSSQEWMTLVDAEINAENWYMTGTATVTPDIASQSGKKRQSQAVTPDIDSDIAQLTGKDRVKAYLDRYPAAGSLEIDELADLLAVSGRTVYRGKELVSKNGYHHV
jgi:hypothetical protein